MTVKSLMASTHNHTSFDLSSGKRLVLDGRLIAHLILFLCLSCPRCQIVEERQASIVYETLTNSVSSLPQRDFCYFAIILLCFIKFLSSIAKGDGKSLMIVFPSSSDYQPILPSLEPKPQDSPSFPLWASMVQ